MRPTNYDPEYADLRSGGIVIGSDGLIPGVGTQPGNPQPGQPPIGIGTGMGLVPPASAPNVGAYPIPVPASSSSGGSSLMPWHILAGTTFTIPVNDQGLSAMTIVNDGILVVDGFLIEVT